MKERDHKLQTGSFQRVVVKLGSALLFSDGDHRVNQPLMNSLASQIAALRERGIQVVLVSSGAIALGAKTMGLQRPPSKISERQALAGIGQSLLMSSWRTSFSTHGIEVAQVLLTHDDLGNRKRYLNASHAIEAMLRMNVIPIVNENDTVSVEEIRLGDNDRLSALVSALIGSDALMILSTATALYDQDPALSPDAHRIPVVENITADILKMASEGISQWGRGGMFTKLEAAKSASRFGIPMFVAHGEEPDVLNRLLQGEDLGTLFVAESKGLKGRKHWIAFSLKPAGDIWVDSGAKMALKDGGKSLLPSGVTNIVGEFGRGDCVRVIGPDGDELGRGLTSYKSSDLQDIMGHNSSKIEGILGYSGSDWVIHRDDLVIEKHR